MDLDTPHRYEPEDLATAGSRFTGRFIDNVVLVVPVVVLLMVGVQVRMPLLALLGLVIWVAVQWFAFQDTGQSLGKRLAGTRVLRVDGRRVGFFRGFLGRDLIVAVAGVTRILGLINSLMIFGNARRCGHDYILDTVVVSDAALALRGIDADRVAEVFR